MNYKLAHNSHAGIKRSHNEDTYGISHQQNTFLVADGMGGHDHGEIASALARDYILDGLADNKTVQQAIYDANEAIITSSLEKGSQLPMGTTIAIMQFTDNQYQCAWVGDSRLQPSALIILTCRNWLISNLLPLNKLAAILTAM